MDQITNLDVLVVYSSNVATSASVSDAESTFPFLIDSKYANCNVSYEYFLQTCKKNGIRAGLTTSADVIGPGTCSNYWTSVAGKWVKVGASAHSVQIFDKLFPVTNLRKTERKLLLSHHSIKPFNDTQLFATFCDKLHTYQELPEYSIPTVTVRSSKTKEIIKAVESLQAVISKHPFLEDFSKKIILKDRFGSGGDHVYKINRDFVQRISALMLEHKQVDFVLQPFLHFNNGYEYKDNKTATDIRMIYYKNTLLQSYIRMAKEDDFRCNQHQGGQLEYLDLNQVPRRIKHISDKIVSKINKPESVYALDFVVSDSQRIYFMEGNIMPGIDWDETNKTDQKMAKQLIRNIVKEFTVRINNHTTLS